MRPPSGQPSARVAAGGGGREQRRARGAAPRTPVASRSSSSIARASSNRSMTACESLPVASARAGVARGARAGPIAVGEVALGRRAQADACEPPSSATSSSVRCVAWIAVKRAPSAPASASSAVGVRPCAARRVLVLRRLLGDVRVQRLAGGPLGDHAARRPGRPRARCGSRRRPAPARARRAASTRAAHASRVAVAEALDARRAGSRRRAACSRSPAAARGGEHGAAHRVGVVVGRAVGRVVEVVELADARDPRQRHLAERGARERRSRSRGRAVAASSYICSRQVQNEPVARVRAPAQRALEGVRVRVGEAGEREAGEAVGVVGAARPASPPRSGPRRSRSARRRSAALAAEPGELARELHAPTRSTTISRARASNAARGGGRTAPRS